MNVFKYDLEVTDTQIKNIPNLREIIDVQIQDGQLVLWAIVDKDLCFYSTVNIYIVGTGQVFNDNLVNYLTTFQYKGFVGHVFYNYGIK